jgi:hypothetical protein
MSVEGELFGTCIDMNRDEIVYALMALDTELNQLHRLCLEQGLEAGYFINTASPLSLLDDEIGCG